MHHSLPSKLLLMTKATELEIIGADQLPDHASHQVWLHCSILRGLPSPELPLLRNIAVFKALKLGKRSILSGNRHLQGLITCRTL